MMMTEQGDWKKQMRQWARGLDATHVRIEGAGLPRHLTIASAINRVGDVHGRGAAARLITVVDQIDPHLFVVAVTGSSRRIQFSEPATLVDGTITPVDSAPSR